MMISKHSRKIAISFIIVLGLSLAMIIFDLSRMSIMQSKLDAITKEHNIKSGLMMEVLHGIYERQVSLRNIMLLKDPFDQFDENENFGSFALNILDARNKFASMPLNEEEKNLLTEINNAMTLAYETQISSVDASIYTKDRKIDKAALQATFITQKVLSDKVKQMIMMQKKATKEAVMDAERSYKAAKSSVYILGGSALLFGIFVALFVIRLTESQARDVNNIMSEIESSHELLEEHVEKRTKELALARDEALESNRSKDVFLANMSHELRTPLNIILGYSELLEDVAKEEGNNKFVSDLKKIQDAAHHQLKLINSLLDISKIEDGKLEIYPIDFDVEQLVAEVEAATKPLMLTNDNTLKISCLADIGLMYSDNMRIRQILLNLLSNSAKFTEQGQISLNVTKTNDGDLIEFEVQDTGIGIDEDYMKDLFKKFTQADSSTTKKYGGSGLGLSISKKLTKQLNGNISVTSIQGKGSTFLLRLPVIYLG